jgi:Flp pilus assembly pilin Flp
VESGMAARDPGRRVSMKMILEFLKAEDAQDLVEYTLLIAFVVFTSVALAINSGGSITGIWTTTNTSLNKGEAFASS